MFDGVTSNLFVSMGRKKLKLHDSATMFEQGVWFSVLIMLPQAWSPPDTEITIRFFMPSVYSHVDSHANRHTHKHGCCNTHKTRVDRHAHRPRNTSIKGCSTRTHKPSLLFSKWLICSDLGEMILRNETDREDDFFIHLGKKQAVALLFMADSSYKHRQWVWSFPITPSHPLQAGSSTLGQTVRLMKASKFIAQHRGELHRESFCHHPLLNQFIGRELRA